MRTRLTGAILLVGLLLFPLLGCSRVEYPTITKEGAFDLEEALAIQQHTFRPVYEFIAGRWPLHGPPDNRFATREASIELLTTTLPHHVAEQIVNNLFGAEGRNVFFPTIFHKDIVIVSAYLERVSFKHIPSTVYLVIEETCSDREANKDLQYFRAVRYTQNSSGKWVFAYMSGTQFYQGEGYSPHGPRRK